jgi:hypothetical protein
MEGVRYQQTVRAAYRAIVVVIMLAGTILLTAEAASARRRYTTDARSNNRGVDFSIQTVSTSSGRATTTASGVSCDYDLQFGNIGEFSGYWKESPSNTSVLARRSCSDGTDEFVWVDGCAFLDLDRVCPQASPVRVDPIVLAREVRDRLPVPGLNISSNPRRGLVGLGSWFWIEDGGRPLSDSLARFGVRVDVKARPISYEWDFGDGTIKTTSSPGRPYPRRSQVTHIYERSSAHLSDGYRVSVEVVFDVRWRTNGRGWRPLPGITRVSERSYRVAESQAVNTNDR